MPSLLVRYVVARVDAEDIAAAVVEPTFAAVGAAAPDGIRCVDWRHGRDFVARSALRVGTDDPWFGLAAAWGAQATVVRWVEAVPPVDALDTHGFAR
jgi:hypothetical protein